MGYTENIKLTYKEPEKAGFWRGVMDFNKLLEKAREYLPPEKIAAVEDAYHFAAEKHQGRCRDRYQPDQDDPG